MHIRSLLIDALSTSLLCLLIGSATGASTNWTLKSDLTFKETYDDNVYILDTPPDPTATPPLGYTICKPQQESLVSSVILGLTLGYKPCAAFDAKLSYAPEFTWYHSAHSEDYNAHRVAFNFTGKIDDVTYESLGSITLIDGDDFGPVTMRPGDCRAIGGIPLRDRRDATIYREGLKVTIPSGKLFFRPVMSVYVHNFQTAQRPSGTNYVYDNYIDRWDVNGGLDVGYEAFAGTKLVAGYRYGHQEQGKRLGVASPYSNDYQRFLIGIEGAPAKWMKLAVLAGPDVRDWGSSVPANFDADELLWWIDGAITLLPGKADTVTIKVTRYEQPAFTSQSVYEDIKYDATWRHRFTAKFTAGLGLTLYEGHWQVPAYRDDWIYTPSVMASYIFNDHLTAEAAWSHDAVENKVPLTAPGATYAEGREFTRNLVSLGVKYSF